MDRDLRGAQKYFETGQYDMAKRMEKQGEDDQCCQLEKILAS